METIFDLCQPRADVLKGSMKDEEFAADLAAVSTGHPKEYADPGLFFQYTYPTRGLKTLLETVCRRLSGVGGELNSVIRLDTQYGGGKTHSLIALVHAVRGMNGVANVDEFVNASILPKGPVRVAALNGENADPANGLKLEDGLLARSLWGEMAYHLAGREGYERVRASDETHTAPGTPTIVELFGGEPTLILIDEVSVYLRKVARAYPDAAGQFTAFMQSLIKAVATTPKAALVCTLAVRAEDEEARDAYRAEQQAVVEAFAEAESIGARSLLQIDPTEEDETIDVLRRRLFERVDIKKAETVVRGYAEIWDRNKEHLSAEATSAEVRDQFRKGYPLHPETLSVMTEKMSSLSTFQRTRGMLRLLARTVKRLWDLHPPDAHAIHPHHVDLAFGPIRDEVITRLGQQAYAPALTADIASVKGTDPSTAQRLDSAEYLGMPPVTTYVARTVFLNTLAYGDAAQGIPPDRLRFSVCSPAIEPAFAEQARKRFVLDSLYLDDRPGAPMRFRVEPNLTQMINRAMQEVDADEVRTTLNTKVKDLFSVRSGNFSVVPFPGGPYEVPDEIGEGRPYLIILNHEAFSVSDIPTELPQELVRMATRKGIKEELRLLQNNLVFVVADARQIKDMQQMVRRHLALQAILTSPKLKDLADHQQRKVNEDGSKSLSMAAIAVLQCYRHLFYPSHISLGRSEAKLGHTSIELQNASDTPGNGQVHIKRALRDQKKLLEANDQPDAPAFVRDQTPLKTKGFLTTEELRNEFRKAPNLSILLDDSPLISCIRLGIDQGVYIYRDRDLVWGKGDPAPFIQISPNAFVHSIEHAKAQKLWPRPAPAPEGEEPEQEAETAEGEIGSSEGATGTRSGSSGRKSVTAGGSEVEKPKSAELSSEGPLKQALTKLFEKARAQNVEALACMTMRFFELAGVKSAYEALAVYRDAETTCSFDVTMDADGITKFEVSFTGSLARAGGLKSFLEQQVRIATDHQFESKFELRFPSPLSTASAKADAFIAAMTKYGAAEAYVEAQAAPRGSGE